MITIKRYSNRKLYDTEARHYISLEDIGTMIREGKDIRVVDHNSATDLTGLTLIQVLFEEEKKIGGLLPQVIIKRLIKSGNRSLDSLRSSLLAFLSPLDMVESEIGRRIEDLLSKKEITEEENIRLQTLLLDPHWRNNKEDEGLSSEEESDQAVSRDEVSALMAQVELLEKSIEKLNTKENEEKKID